MGREHHIDNGADCWCEPRIELVEDADGKVSRIVIHGCKDCGHNPCLCPANIIGGES